MPQPELRKSDLIAVLADVHIPDMLGTDRHWRTGVDAGAFYIQLIFMAVDPDYPNAGLKKQSCRKWRISRFSTRTEIVETAFKACKAAVEHEMAEQFRYREQPIYSPHFDVDARVEMCRTARYDKRED